MATRSIMANEEQELVLTRVFDAPRCGGVPTDLLTQSASWTYGPAAPSAFTCAAQTAPSIP